jgi:hypothetical protein
MAFREEIKVIVDFVTGNAKGALGQLRTDLDATDGAFNKMKVGGSAAFDFVKQNAIGFGLAAGAAVTGFAVKAIGDFQEVALGAGKLSDSLGITMEEASRLQEVAGDLGIGVGTVESAIGKMNKTVAASPQHFDAIGAAIKRNRDGTLDVIGTFQSAADAIDKIPDAGRRAEAAQKIFGRGWQEIAVLIEGGADGIAAAMAEVESAKIMTVEDRKRAEKFRDTMDELKGVMESVAIAVGESVVPVITDVAAGILDVKNKLEDLKNAIPGGGAFWNWLTTDITEFLAFGPQKFGELKDQIADLGEKSVTASVAMGDLHSALFITGGEFETTLAASDYLGDSLGTLSAKERDAAEAGINAAKAVAEMGDETSEATAKSIELHDALVKQREATIDAAGGAFDLESAELDLIDKMAALEQQTRETNLIQLDGKRSAEDKAAASRDLRSAEIGAADGALQAAEKFAEQGGAADGSRQKVELMRQYLVNLQNQFPGLSDEIQAYINKLNAIPATRTTTVRLNLPAGFEPGNSNTPQIRAAGGPVKAGEPYIVGDRFGVNSPSAELFVPEQDGTIIPMGGGRAAAVGGTTNYITIHTGADPRAVIRAIKDYERDNGKGWRAS